MLMRLFVALEISDELRGALEALRSRLLPLTSLRLVDPEQLHLTLKFLGEVPEEKVHKVVAELEKINFSPVKLETTRMGTFPHVLWLGVRLTKELAQLQQGVARAVRPFTTHDPRSYKPHLTLARFRALRPDERARLDRVVKSARLRERWKADAFILYQSELTSDGPVYTAVKRFGGRREERV